MRRSRRAITGSMVTVLVAVATTACAIDEVMPAPTCGSTRAVALVAQSVPGARFVPCIEDRGVGWRPDDVHVDESGTRVRFSLGAENRTVGELSFASSCAELAGDLDARPVDLGVAGVAAEEFDNSSRRYRFDGGCVVVSLASGVGPQAAGALVESIVLVQRDDVGADVRRDVANGRL